MPPLSYREVLLRQLDELGPAAAVMLAGSARLDAATLLSALEAARLLEPDTLGSDSRRELRARLLALAREHPERLALLAEALELRTDVWGLGLSLELDGLGGLDPSQDARRLLRLLGLAAVYRLFPEPWRHKAAVVLARAEGDAWLYPDRLLHLAPLARALQDALDLDEKHPAMQLLGPIADAPDNAAADAKAASWTGPGPEQLLAWLTGEPGEGAEE